MEEMEQLARLALSREPLSPEQEYQIWCHQPLVIHALQRRVVEISNSVEDRTSKKTMGPPDMTLGVHIATLEIAHTKKSVQTGDPEYRPFAPEEATAEKLDAVINRMD
jgi:hypothetical protein